MTIKTGNRIPLPSNIEQFRQRVHLWGTSWIMAASMHTNRRFLRDLDPMVFTHYLTHMLGEHVMGLISQGPTGSAVVGDLWFKFLDYEWEIRKHCMKECEKDEKTLAQNLRAAYKDVEIKMLHFTDPIQFKLKRKADQMVDTVVTTPGGVPTVGAPSAPGQGKRSVRRAAAIAAAAAQQQQTWTPPGKGKGKKGKKGKGKGKGVGKGKCKSKTSDGKPVCYAFNNPNEYCPGNCGREHVCGICGARNRPMHLCDHSAGAANPSG